MQPRALIYARVSTEDQLEKYGMPAQLSACRDFAKGQGFDVIKEITDDGISGAILDRPGLDRLRELVDGGAVDVVVMLDPDRLSRDMVHLVHLKRELDKRCRMEFVTGSFERTTSGKMFFGMKAVIAEYERDVIRDRTIRGKRERARSGRRVGGREPFGYRDEDGSLVVEADRALVARQMFEWYDAGLSLCEITRRLRMAGVSTWSGKPWWYTAVRSILTNEVYAGVGHWGQDRIAIPVPALVSRELWERVKARLEAVRCGRSPNVGRPSSAYLLRGLLECQCGRKMYGETAKSGTRRYPWYRCQSRNKTLAHRPYCGAAVSAAKLDAAVWSKLTQAFTDAGQLHAMVRDHEMTVKACGPDRALQLESQAAKLRRREQAALDLMADPDLAEDRGAIKRQYVDAQTERRRIEAELAAGRRVASIQAGAWIDETVKLLQDYIPQIESAEKKQEFVKGMVSRAVWTGEVLKLACFIGPKSGTSSRRIDGFPESLEILLNVRLAA